MNFTQKQVTGLNREFNSGDSIKKTLVTFLLKISRNLNFIGKIDWSMNLGRQRPKDS